MAQINLRIDDDVKNEAEELFSRIGMNMTTAIMVFIRQSIADDGIPFRIKANRRMGDRERFVQAGVDYENGKVNYHYHDLPDDGSVAAGRMRRAKTMA